MERIATFIGKNGSCGLVNGKQYAIRIVDNRGKLLGNDPFDFRVVVNDGISIPYDTMNGIKKNWDLSN